MGSQGSLQYIDRMNMCSCRSASLSGDKELVLKADKAIENVEKLKKGYKINNVGKIIRQEIFFGENLSDWVACIESYQDPDIHGGKIEVFAPPLSYCQFIIQLKSGRRASMKLNVVGDSETYEWISGDHDLCLIPRKTGYVYKSMCDDPLSTMHFLISPSLILEILNKSGSVFSSRFKLNPSIGKNDSVAADLVKAILGCSARNGVGQMTNIMNAFLVYIVEQYGEPEEDVNIAPFSKSELLLIEEEMMENMGVGIDISKLARKLNKTRGCFMKKFKLTMNQTPLQYYNVLRMKKAKELVELTDKGLTNIGVDLGFSDGAHFSKSFSKFWGVTPSKIRTRSEVGLEEA